MAHTKKFRGVFHDLVLAAAAGIPEGETLSYGQVAFLAGHPGAARAAGAVLRTNYDPNVPCHRVVYADGSVGNYNRGGSERKSEILREERVRAAASVS
jgi:methylated-DNA-[protein]-cysteine S-methyltransferase